MTLTARLNLWLYGITKHWLKGVLLFWLIFASGPVAAPVLMKLGAEAPARAIYSLYQPFCHRFAFRSFFLFGEQAAYPLAAAPTDYKSFESYAGQSPLPAQMAANQLPMPPFGIRNMPEFEAIQLNGITTGLTIYDNLEPQSQADAANFARVQLAAGAFLGNDQMGFKLAVCERDISIYLGLLFAAVIYSVPRVRRRLRPLPIWMYLIIGLGPIGLDGFSQLLGYPPFNLWPARETTPLFRALTGLIFGLATAWLGYPNIELSMNETRALLGQKLRKAGLIR
jgi:uncharacterized membrane protein